MKTIALSAAALLFAGAASAQDAYINQLGDQLNAVNYSEYSTGNDAQQVIVQQGVGFSAGQLSRGPGNSATTYQIDSTSNTVNSLTDTTSGNTVGSGATANSFIWQKNDGFTNGNNTAVAVQLNQQGPGSQNSSFLSQIIQEGNDNTAVNWSQDQAGTMAGQNLLGTTTLTATVAPSPTPLPVPVVNAGYPFGGTITTP
ncbi:hypothetical protein SAMN05421853_107213 [Roseivivax halotolerans]|uniref:Curlin associated repeat-containing protein n=1 Tax=Roseivivax halotolerans TaxID=93684 RepID=A0A1I5Z349_9RHOB|nr:hypothetical protein [Roseivivax halotolerans]SFQ50899.1 hypothetical protein SAMN05421853_107213 [Roseivivax halotolerans]